MGRGTREVWRKRVERWVDSGLTAEEFSKEARIRAGTLRHWKWRLAAEARGWRARSRARPRFVEVAVTSAEPGSAAKGGEGFELVLAGGALLRMPARVEGEALRHVVAVLSGADGRRLLREGR
jgi:hypothetical protein